MKKHYRVECYAKNGYVVLINECEANCLEDAIGTFVHQLVNIHEYDEDFDTDLAYAIIQQLCERFTVSFSTDYPEMGPPDKQYRFTNITVQLDENI